MGQNLASWGSTTDIDDESTKSAAGAITNQWYNGELESFDGVYGSSNPPSNLPLGAFGHFTQIVWKDTQKVGCATVKCAAGTVLGMQSWYTVCNYSPPGMSPFLPHHLTIANVHRQLWRQVRYQRSQAPRPGYCHRLSDLCRGYIPSPTRFCMLSRRQRAFLEKTAANGISRGSTCYDSHTLWGMMKNIQCSLHFSLVRYAKKPYLRIFRFHPNIRTGWGVARQLSGPDLGVFFSLSQPLHLVAKTYLLLNGRTDTGVESFCFYNS